MRKRLSNMRNCTNDQSNKKMAFLIYDLAPDLSLSRRIVKILSDPYLYSLSPSLLPPLLPTPPGILV
jgi:hypothetical protein